MIFIYATVSPSERSYAGAARGLVTMRLVALNLESSGVPICRQ